MDQRHDILIISNGFFGYSKEIAAYLQRNGRNPKLIEDRPATDTLTKTLIRINPALVAGRSDRYFAEIMENLRDHPIRDVLVIRGEALSAEIIKQMRGTWPNARFTLYFWDSFRNLPSSIVATVPIFDRVFSFDPIDVQQDSRLTYRPLFYLDQYRNADPEPIEPAIGLLFVGTLHSDRARVLWRLAKALPEKVEMHTYLYLRTGPEYLAYKALARIVRPSWTVSFIRRPLSAKNIVDLYSRSRVILDIERSIQSGYTMRTIEVLAAQRKLITTNRAVASADFYDADNVMVIDRERPVMDPAFFDKPMRPTDESIIRGYSLASWVDTVLLEKAP